MIAFGGVAFFLLVAAVVGVLWLPLKCFELPVVGRGPVQPRHTIAIRFSELEKDLEAGTLGVDRYERAKMNWRGASLEEAAVPADTPHSATPGKAVPDRHRRLPFRRRPSCCTCILATCRAWWRGAIRRPTCRRSRQISLVDVTALSAARMQQNPGMRRAGNMLWSDLPGNGRASAKPTMRTRRRWS